MASASATLRSSSTMRIRGCDFIEVISVYRQYDFYLRASADTAVHMDAAAMLFDHLRSERHAKSEPLAFRGVKRLEHILHLLGGHAAAIVGNDQFNFAAAIAGGNLQAAAILHRLDGIEQQVNQRRAHRRLVKPGGRAGR